MWELVIPAAAAFEIALIAAAWKSRTLVNAAKKEHYTTVKLGKSAASVAALEAIADVYRGVRELSGPITSPNNNPDDFVEAATRFTSAMESVERIERLYDGMKRNYKLLPILLGLLALLFPLGVAVVGFRGWPPGGWMSWSVLGGSALVAALCLVSGGTAIVLEQRLPSCAEAYAGDGESDE